MKVWRCWAVLLVWMRADRAWGCPVCYSRTGMLVRAGILDHAFGRNVLVTLLPFAVFGALVTWVYYQLPVPSVAEQKFREER